MYRQDFILAYYSIWILATLRSEEAMEERLKSITGTLLDHMAVVMTILVDDRLENKRVYLGVSRPTTGLQGGHHICTFEASWGKAFRKVIESLDNVGSPMAINMHENFDSHLNCGNSPGITHVGDEESAGLEGGL